MAEAGITEERPAEWGPAITDDWWSKCSDAVLRRLIGFGGGEGPPQDQTQRLSKAFQIIFHAPESSDHGERAARTFTRSESESTEHLYVTLCDALAARCGPLVQRQVAEVKASQQDRPSSPSAAISGKPSLPRRRSSPNNARSVRPQPPSPSRDKNAPPQLGWWQQVIIDATKRQFDEERLARERIYEEYLAALDPPLQLKFMAEPSVRPNPMLWEARFNRALAIAATARGIKQEMLDDAYHFGERYQVPANLQSQSILGELIHAAWQFHYLDAEPHSSVLAEFMFAAGALPDALPPIRETELRDYREIVTDEEVPTWLGAARWAFGKQKPDILDFTKRRIIEIKPVRGAPAGVLQLWRYTHNFNCARCFDELTKAGAMGTERYALEPQSPDANCLPPLDLNEFLEQYFAAEDEERDRAAVRKGRIPSKRRRVGRTEVERSVRAGRKLKVVPFLLSDIPGLVLYLVHDENKPEQEQPDSAPSNTARNVVLVVTTLVVVAAVVAAIALLPVAVGAATASAALAETGAVTAALTSGEVAMVEMFGAGFQIGEFAAAASKVSSSLVQLGAAGVL